MTDDKSEMFLKFNFPQNIKWLRMCNIIYLTITLFHLHQSATNIDLFFFNAFFSTLKRIIEFYAWNVTNTSPAVCKYCCVKICVFLLLKQMFWIVFMCFEMLQLFSLHFQTQCVVHLMNIQPVWKYASLIIINC